MRQVFGGRVRQFITGAAPIALPILELFWAAGLPIYEVFGMTDATVLSCTAVLAASSPYGGAANDPINTGAARKLPVVMQIGTLDSAYSAAQTTDATLMTDGFPIQFNAIQGAGHVPIPGDIAVPLVYCLGQSL